jgi:protein MpaA
MDVRMLKSVWLVALVLFCGCSSNRNDTMTQPRALKAEAATQPQPVNLVEREVELGRSVEDREIVVRVLGNSGDVTLIMGAIHGNEPSSAVVAERLLEHLRSHPEQLEGRRVAILTVANPDGLARRLRTNKHLVDLNRNFPANNWTRTRRGVYFGGTAAASEPETVALIRLFDEIKPSRVISIHSMDKPCNNYDGPAKAMAEMMSALNGYQAKDNIGYPTPGSLGSWAGIDRQIPMITLELPRKMGGEEAWEQNRQALLAVISMRV